MRVGPYEPKYGQPPGANREAFQKVLEAILNELGGIDIASFMPDIANDESGGYKKIERVQVRTATTVYGITFFLRSVLLFYFYHNCSPDIADFVVVFVTSIIN